MVICPDCGKEVKDAKYCSNCGSALPKVDDVKESVGEVENTIDAKFAEKPVEEEPVNETVEEVVPEVAEANVVEEVVPEAGEADVVEEVVPEVAEANVVEEVVPEVGETNVEPDLKPAEESVGEEIKVETPKEEPFAGSGVKKSKFCTNCGNELKDDIAFCPICGFKVHQEEAQLTKFCQTCGKKINIDAVICPYCGVRVAGMAPTEEKNVLLAAILSFIFPGLGHIYNGLTRKGISFIIAYLVSCVLVMLLVGIILVIVVWIWALVDAIRTTEALNRGESVEDKLF